MFYDNYSKAIKLDGSDRYKNFMPIDGYDCELAYLESGPPGGKGCNSSVFRVVPINESESEFVIKFCRYPDNARNRRERRRIERFGREIDAIKKAAKASFTSEVIELITDNRHVIDGQSFRYYVMPKADRDLTQHLDEEQLELSSKLVLCKHIFEAIHRLHSIDIYHRDIKPDNFLVFGNTVRIGDLGLIAYRGEDCDLDKGDKQIGPFGFLSPEAANRCCATAKSPTFGLACSIDDLSDYYQLGLLFWYIMQAEVPVGQLQRQDLKIEGTDHLFHDLIIPLLQFDKHRRPDYQVISKKLADLIS